MMRSLLDGSISPAQRAQIPPDFATSRLSTTSGPATRLTIGQKRPRGRPLPPSPGSSRGSPRGHGRGGPPGSADSGGVQQGRQLDQDGLRRQMDLLSQDARQRTDGRQIKNIMHTNTVTTVYTGRRNTHSTTHVLADQQPIKGALQPPPY